MLTHRGNAASLASGARPLPVLWSQGPDHLCGPGALLKNLGRFPDVSGHREGTNLARMLESAGAHLHAWLCFWGFFFSFSHRWRMMCCLRDQPFPSVVLSCRNSFKPSTGMTFCKFRGTIACTGDPSLILP